MRLRLFFGLTAGILAFTYGLLWANTRAQAEYVITDNLGGTIGNFKYEFQTIALSGERIRIKGKCRSACTIVLMLRPGRICVEPDAQFGFHAAWVDGENGQRIISPEGTRELWQWYPPKVKRWILAHGGLTLKMIYLKGDELMALYPRCKDREDPWAVPAFADVNGVVTPKYPLFWPPPRAN